MIALSSTFNFLRPSYYRTSKTIVERKSKAYIQNKALLSGIRK